ncbi:MAG: helix-hairpin-helix domain-containing protein [Clostridiales bacterium]|nr:helix-hairpin-helix domain-containing protein [Clostridiales bacterium]
MEEKQNGTQTENKSALKSKAQDNDAETKSSKYQTLVLIGIGLIILGAIFVVIALYQPTVSTQSSVQVASVDSVQSTQDEAVEAVAETGTDSSLTSTNSQESSAPYSAAVSASATTAGTTTSQAATTTQATAQTALSSAATTTAAPATTAAATTALSVSYPLNLNTCTQEELETLDSIGEARAYAIISYREYLGGYTSTEQIKDIKGISDGIYEKIKDYITV